jgi:hypothetical protein
VSTKDAIFIVGVIVILIFALAEMPGPSDHWSAKRRKEGAATGKLVYAVGLLTWACIVNFFEFRRGLATRVGLPDAIAWGLALIGLILLLALSIAQFADEEGPWWKWVGLFLLYLAVVAGWFIAAGPGSW